MLVTGALVASLFAVGAGPAAAQPNAADVPTTPNHDPDAGADWSACVGAASSHDAMFSDVDADSVHAGDINCIAAYGVTIGMGDGTYGPGANVTAFEMGLFVQRAADLMGADGEEVLAGVELSDHVTRLEMAQLMFGLVDDIDDDVRIHPRSGQIEFYNDDTNKWDVVDDFFADAKAQVPIFESQTIGAIYELGITRGTRGDGTLVSTPGSTFEPSAPVTRAQMASFITRTLDHSNLRPEGLAVQRNTSRETMVSYRDEAFMPIEDARIDVLSSLYPDDAFDPDDGECELRFVKDETPSHDVCQIDIGDQLTDDEGNVEFTLASDSDPVTAACATDSSAALRFETAPGSAGRTFWAWTGDRGDEVDEDTDLQELEDVARPVGKAGPNYARVTGGLPTSDELAKMGETVTFTLQLYSEVGTEPNADKDIAVGPDRSRNPYHLRIEKYYVARVDGTDSDHGSDTGDAAKSGSASGAGQFSAAPGDWNYVLSTNGTTVASVVSDAADARPLQTPTDTVVWPNSDGEYPITLTHLDLNAAPAANNVDVGVRFTLTPFTQGNDLIAGNLLDSLEASGNHAMLIPEGTAIPAGGTTPIDVVSGHVIFSDDASDPHSVSGGSAGAYQIIAGSRTGNSVTVTVLDQYGDGMRNVEISVESSLDYDGRPDEDGTADADGNTVDEVVYPEEVDDTVQPNEDTVQDGTDGPDVDTDDDEPNPGQANDDLSGTFKTRRNGAYRIGYTYIGASAQTEEITPESVELTGDDPDTAAVETAFVTREQEVGTVVSVYWAKTGNTAESHTTAGGVLEPVPLLVRDVANQTIVANEPLLEGDDTDNPMAYFYDEDDTFIIAGVGATFEMFEEALSATYKDDKIYASMVEWENYTLARPGRVNRTIWELTLSCMDPATLRVSDDGASWVARS